MPLVEGVFYGIKAAVLVIVVEALLRVAKRALSQRWHWAVAGLAFVGIFFLSIPYPLIVLIAALVGWFMATGETQAQIVDMSHVSIAKTGRTIGIWLAIWLLPLLGLTSAGAPDLLVQVGTFFSTLAVVTFGGAYAVLAYMAQDVVVQFGWLSPQEMVDALGLAETTPGPLILVTEFVGFLAGYKDGGLALGIAAALVALWMTFAPCFLWIFAGAPYIDWISNQPRLNGALKAITAAAVGVILNLSIWFALHVLFARITRLQMGPITLWQPDLATIEWFAMALFLLFAFLALRLRWSIIRILILAAGLGAAGQVIL